jgi:CDK inhibitor PHO81
VASVIQGGSLAYQPPSAALSHHPKHLGLEAETRSLALPCKFKHFLSHVAENSPAFSIELHQSQVRYYGSSCVHRLDPARSICKHAALVASVDAFPPSDRKFGKTIQKRQLEIPEYAASFVDYKALKKVCLTL